MNTNQEEYEIEITYTPEEEEEFYIRNQMANGDYFEVNAKILKILSDRLSDKDPEMAKYLGNQSRWFFEVVDESKRLKIGTSRKKHYYMTYEKKIADIIKNRQEAIDDVYWGLQIKFNSLLPQEIRKLEKLRYYEKEEVREYEYDFVDNYDGTPDYNNYSDSDPDEDDHFDDYMARELNIY